MASKPGLRRLRDKRGAVPWPPPRSQRVPFHTPLGAIYQGLAEDVLASELKSYQGKVSLILTSPPFPLNRKKKYGNKVGDEYLDWLALFAPTFRKLIKPSGSVVMEMGNAWEPGRPVMSTLSLEALLRFVKTGKLQLCQQFVWNNPSRLPTPVQWVNIKRVRVKDAFTTFGGWLALRIRSRTIDESSFLTALRCRTCCRVVTTMAGNVRLSTTSAFGLSFKIDKCRIA